MKKRLAKLASLFLAGTMLLSMVGCGGGSGTDNLEETAEGNDSGKPSFEIGRAHV